MYQKDRKKDSNPSWTHRTVSGAAKRTTQWSRRFSEFLNRGRKKSNPWMHPLGGPGRTTSPHSFSDITLWKHLPLSKIKAVFLISLSTWWCWSPWFPETQLHNTQSSPGWAVPERQVEYLIPRGSHSGWLSLLFWTMKRAECYCPWIPLLLHQLSLQVGVPSSG